MNNCELLLIRGLPGSGKSTMAREFERVGYVHCEADQYFESDGVYLFDASKLSMAHGECLRRASAAINSGKSCVVANTFTQAWELLPYFEEAKRAGVMVRVLEATGRYKNIHGVQESAIARMRIRWHSIDRIESELAFIN